MVSSSCFGVTYEGLKLGSVLKTRDGRYGFGVTYEGLKRIVEDTQPGLWVGFGVTYEGLKPDGIRSSPIRSCGCFGVTYEGLKQLRERQGGACGAGFWSYL